MANAELTSFRSYVSHWWKAAWAPAYDAVGLFGIVVGGGIWAWHKWWPDSFKWSATRIGLSEEAAMSDLVWIVPISLGALVLLYRLFRAPYEMHLAEKLQHSGELAVLNARVAALEDAREFKVSIQHGGYYIAASKPNDNCQMPGVWLVYYDVVLTNQTHKQLPLELWLMVGMNADGTYRYGEVAQSTIGEWALSPKTAGDSCLERLINLPAWSAVDGFCFTNLGHRVCEMAGVADVKELAGARPFWLEVKNKLTGESKHHAINALAARIDLMEPKA